jgi:hypothetical protein
MIPGLFNNLQLSSQKLLRTKDDAKNDAAEFFLMQLFPPTYTQSNGSFSSSSLNQDQTVFYGTNQNATQLIPLNNNGNNNKNTGLSNGISTATTSNNMEINNNLYSANTSRQANDFNVGLIQQHQQHQLTQPQFIYDPSGIRHLSI